MQVDNLQHSVIGLKVEQGKLATQRDEALSALKKVEGERDSALKQTKFGGE